MRTPFATASELTALRLQLRANDYHPVPVLGAHVNKKSAGKRPSMRAWETRCFNANPQDIEDWSTAEREATNTGLLCGELVGTDIDVLDPELSAKLVARAVQRLGHSPLQRIGREPKILLAYRVAAPFKKLQTAALFFGDDLPAPEEKETKVEILAQGQQFVAFGIHPDTRAPYRWPEASPLDVPAAQLPLTTLEELQAFVAEAEQILRAGGARTKQEIKDHIRDTKTTQQRHETQERQGKRAGAFRSGEKPSRELIAHALDHIPGDLSYDDWVRIGFALYDGLGDSGRDLWERWSARSDKNDSAFTAKKWPSFATGRTVTVATLFWYAKQNGWRRPTGRARAAGQATSEEHEGAAARPTIRIAGGNLPDVVSAAETALLGAEIGIYQRGEFIVRPAIVKVTVADNRKTKAVRLVPVCSHHLAEQMTRVANFERFDGRAEEWVPIDCPKRVADTYLARKGKWLAPVLAGVVNCPVLRPDGSVLDQSGYDASTGLLFDPQGAVFGPVPANPDKVTAARALKVLVDLIATFPFVGPADRSVALSAILTALHRRALPTAPLHGFTAPAAGSGKSMFVDIVSMIVDGRQAAVMALGGTEEEGEKRLGAALLAGDTIISIDNITRPFGGEAFCQALTQTSLKIRILGLSQQPEVPSNAAMFATGNNLTLVGDMTRRAVMCSLDAGVERPELRKFDRSPLAMIRDDRNRYVTAALTTLRAFHVAGRPQFADPLGSFEEWSRWIRDALLWLGEADPCATMEKARANDPALEALTAVVTQWHEVIGVDERVSVKTVIDKATGQTGGGYPNFGPRTFNHPEFREALLTVAGDGGAINSRRLGKWLSANQNRLVNGYKLVADGILVGIGTWKLKQHRATKAPDDTAPRF